MLRPGRAAALLALGLLALWHVTLRRHGLALPLMSDEGEYAYQAQVMADGDVPYRDAYNQKPPLIFFLYRAARALFGESPAAPRVLALLFSLGVMALLYLMTPRGWPPPVRLVAPAAYATLSTLPVGDLGFAANCESFAALFAAASAWAVNRSFETRQRVPWFALGGLFMGLALLTKQTSLWTALGFGLAGALDRRGSRLRPALGYGACFAAGAAAAVAPMLAYFAVRGGLSDLLEQAFSRNLDYASVILASGSAGRQLGWLFSDVLPRLLSAAWPVAALAGYALVKTRLTPERRFEALATVWLGSALVGAATGLFFFPHYFIAVIPPLALLAVVGAERCRERRPWIASWWLLGALTLYPALVHARAYFVDSPNNLAKKLLHPNPLLEAKAVGEYLAARTAPGEDIYVFGSEPQIYVYAGRRAATQHDFVFPLTLFPKDAAYVERELARLEAAPPRFLVYVDIEASTLVATRLGERFRDGVLALLSSRYRLKARVDVAADALEPVVREERGPLSPAARETSVSSLLPPDAPVAVEKGGRLLVFERK